MFYKWEIESVRGSSSYIQLSEFCFYDQNSEVISFPSGTTVESTVAGNSTGEAIGKIIDGSTSTKYCAKWNTTTKCTITFYIPEDINPFYYGYYTGNDATERDPVSWNLYRSSDGTEWTLLDTQTNADIPTTRKAATPLWEIATQPTIIRKYLIGDSGIFYNALEGSLNILEVSELTADIFTEFGMDEIPSGELLIDLSKPKIYCWQSDMEEMPVLHANVNAVPFWQTIQTNEIDLSNGTITGIESVTVTCNGTPTFALSFDSGMSWKMHNGTAWVMLSEGVTGMQAETLEAITPEQWNEEIATIQSMLFRFTLNNAEDTVTSVVIDFTN